MKYLFITFCLLHSLVAVGQLIPSDFKESVAFIFTKDSAGLYKPQGTGFFISTPFETDTTGGWIYLATAKHVLIGNNGYLKEISLRLTKGSDSTLGFVNIPLYESGPKKNIYLSKDDNADVAIVDLPQQVTNFSFRVLTPNFFVSKNEYKKLNIQEGTEVFFVGMFPQFLGTKKNYPITRFGRVASLPDEKVYWNNKLQDLYMLETTTYWGNSGSPVFFTALDFSAPTVGIRVAPDKEFKLAGVMSGFFGDFIPTATGIPVKIPYSLVHFGIAAVTPGYVMYDILFGQEMKAIRKRLELKK